MKEYTWLYWLAFALCLVLSTNFVTAACRLNIVISSDMETVERDPTKHKLTNFDDGTATCESKWLVDIG